VVVRPGDTLWAIARSRLGPGADDARVAHDVDRWHRLNHDVIGDDPDLIHPGQRLTAPTKDRP
jgi:nucleoid-associated protein YgaU